MLSYRHSYHAGNFADVLKHIVLVQVVDYLQRKDKGITIVDTHAGAGMYRLNEEHAQKTAEFHDGIGKLWQRDESPEAALRYLDIVRDLNQDGALTLYPGSPEFSASLLRRQDNLRLFELHSTDYVILREHMAGKRRVKVQVDKVNGYKGVMGCMPPVTRRGLVLIDPPFEIKTDYEIAVDTIAKAWQRFAGGTYILWYPVVQRHYVDSMEQAFKDSGIKNVMQIEYLQSPDTEVHGMTGHGLFVVNPPWVLKEQMEQVLPWLIDCMGDEQSSWRIEQLVAE